MFYITCTICSYSFDIIIFFLLYQLTNLFTPPDLIYIIGTSHERSILKGWINPIEPKHHKIAEMHEILSRQLKVELTLETRKKVIPLSILTNNLKYNTTFQVCRYRKSPYPESRVVKEESARDSENFVSRTCKRGVKCTWRLL